MANEETLYARYISGELTPTEKAMIEQNGDKDKLDAIIEMTDRFRLPSVDKKTGFDKLVQQKRNQPQGRIISLPYLRWIVSAAAVALLAVGIFHIMKNDVVELSAAYATTLTHEFGDGSFTQLNAGSEISYDKDAWDRQRNVHLKGEAYFEVEKGAPFVVNTHLGNIRVLGTKFNVRSHENLLKVECFEGMVRVQSGSADQQLTATQGIEIRSTTTSSVYTVGGSPDWSNGRSSFRNVSLNDVCRELERQYDIQVVNKTNGLNFRGSFDNNDLESAVNEIAKPLGIKAIISADRKHVTFSN